MLGLNPGLDWRSTKQREKTERRPVSGSRMRKRRQQQEAKKGGTGCCRIYGRWSSDGRAAPGRRGCWSRGEGRRGVAGMPAISERDGGGSDGGQGKPAMDDPPRLFVGILLQEDRRREAIGFGPDPSGCRLGCDGKGGINGVDLEAG